jgi:peroxiredoxin
LHKRYDDVEKRGAVAVAISQEDTDLESAKKFLRHFEGSPRFVIAADFGRAKTGRLSRTTTYVVDSKGVVREIMPALVRTRPSWDAVLGVVDGLDEGKKAAAESKE